MLFSLQRKLLYLVAAPLAHTQCMPFAQVFFVARYVVVETTAVLPTFTKLRFLVKRRVTNPLLQESYVALRGVS
jgi:hypothetical protein